MKTNKNKIEDLFNNRDIITSREAENAGVKRHILARLVNEVKLERVRKGMYSLPNEISDRYEVLQKNNSRMVFSYGTALYFLNMSDRIPMKIHISVLQGYNASHVDKYEENIKVHQKENL